MHDCLLCKALVPDTVSEHASTAESNLRVIIPGNKKTQNSNNCQRSPFKESGIDVLEAVRISELYMLHDAA